MTRYVKLLAVAYARYLVGYSIAKHSILISISVCLSTFPAMYLYAYLVDFTPLSKADSRIWAIAGPTALWFSLLCFVGISLRLAPTKEEEARYVKLFQYSFSFIALIVFLACLDVSNEKGVIVLVLIFEIPALIFVVSHSALTVISGRKLTLLSWLSLFLTTLTVLWSVLKVY